MQTNHVIPEQLHEADLLAISNAWVVKTTKVFGELLGIETKFQCLKYDFVDATTPTCCSTYQSTHQITN